jgi:hypothetical protein
MGVSDWRARHLHLSGQVPGSTERIAEEFLTDLVRFLREAVLQIEAAKE